MLNFIKILLCGISLTLLMACSQFTNESVEIPRSTFAQAVVDTTIATRFAPPKGYRREAQRENSFASYLRKLSLYPKQRKVRLFNNQLKANQSAQAAVVKMDVGQIDLQQCADAVMRLRAEYLWQSKAYNQIQFNFTSGFPADYSSWRHGKRIKVDGNKVQWTPKGSADNSYSSFRKYLNTVFMYAGTYSLSQELNAIDFQDLQIGDVFIQGGFPGHAVIVVDLAEHPNTGDKAFLLAQSYMPAQDIHVLKNPSDKSDWYFAKDINDEIRTPEWTFYKRDLMRF